MHWIIRSSESQAAILLSAVPLEQASRTGASRCPCKKGKENGVAETAVQGQVLVIRCTVQRSVERMLRKLISIFAAAALLFASVPVRAAAIDTRISFSGTSVSVFSGVLSSRFQGIGSGAYVFPLASPSFAPAFFLTNTGGAGNALTVTYQIWVTGSVTVADFSNNASFWGPAQTYDPQNSLQISGQPQTVTISGNTTIQLQTPIANAAQVAIIFTNANSAVIPLSLSVVLTSGAMLPKTSAANVSVQPQVVFNSDQTGASNQQILFTVGGLPGRSVYLYSIAGFCTGGSASLSVTDGLQAIWHTPANAVQTTFISFDWPVPLAGSQGFNFLVTMSACGVGNTGILIVQASQQ